MLQEAYNRKENKATKCRRQMVTFSTFLCLVQIGLLVAMIQDDGYAPKSENPMYGPGSYTLVRYGAKVAALIKYENEWWRLITPIFLHAGIIHIISNVGIQLRVGGYLELVFGRPAWLFIYFSSGVYGNMLSCIFLPDAVGIGSSGAVLGMLTSWIVWILFRWFKVPAESRGQRNCQLLVVTAAVVMTLAFSFSDYGACQCHSLCVLACHNIIDFVSNFVFFSSNMGSLFLHLAWQWTGPRTLEVPFKEPLQQPCFCLRKWSTITCVGGCAPPRGWPLWCHTLGQAYICCR